MEDIGSCTFGPVFMSSTAVHFLTSQGWLQSTSQFSRLSVTDRYIALHTFPVTRAVFSPDFVEPRDEREEAGSVAVAGNRGFCIYCFESKKWRIFGNVVEERAISTQLLFWYGS